MPVISCLICGCTDDTACWDEEIEGYCSWTVNFQDICTVCDKAGWISIYPVTEYTPPLAGIRLSERIDAEGKHWIRLLLQGEDPANATYIDAVINRMAPAINEVQTMMLVILMSGVSYEESVDTRRGLIRMMGGIAPGEG